VALENTERSRGLADNFRLQAADQKSQVETLKAALGKLEQKLAEARSKRDLLIAQHRRSRALTKASEARIEIGDAGSAAAFERMKEKVQREEAVSEAQAELAGDNLDDRFQALERDERIERMLAELKAQRSLRG
jgi:phage shock protein A